MESSCCFILSWRIWIKKKTNEKYVGKHSGCLKHLINNKGKVSFYHDMRVYVLSKSVRTRVWTEFKHFLYSYIWNFGAEIDNDRIKLNILSFIIYLLAFFWKLKVSWLIISRIYSQIQVESIIRIKTIPFGCQPFRPLPFKPHFIQFF